MSSFRFDQAEGLRRLLGEPRQQVFSLLSTARFQHKCFLFFNLASLLVRQGSRVVVLDAITSPDGVAHYHPPLLPAVTLEAVASGTGDLDGIFSRFPHGFDLMRLSGHSPDFRKNSLFAKRLDFAFESAITGMDIVMIDARLDHRHGFPLSMMAESQLIIHVSDTEKSIKDAYLLVKCLTHRFGRIPLGVLVSGSEERHSQTVFRNMAHAAESYLDTTLYFMGHVPKEVYPMQAAVAAGTARNGVTDSFSAFQHLAGSFSARETASRNAYETTGA
ncbi:MAG: hypothetical protein LBK01_09160 [Burkholderiaceae bacterium]|nr:hypothetical protein [Burkholderiaceae bacterium]